jgi:hypothetical protein
MNARVFTRHTIALMCLAALPSCQTSAPATLGVSRAELQRQLADSRALVGRYETRYGKLLPTRPVHDFRKLRAELKGKTMSDVRAVLGKPGNVFALATSEAWDYSNIAYDPASGRTVRHLEIWFSKGVVDRMAATF